MNPDPGNRKEKMKKKKMQKKQLLKYCMEAMDRLAAAEGNGEFECPPNLSKDQRKELHTYAMHCNLNPTYRGSGNLLILVSFR